MNEKRVKVTAFLILGLLIAGCEQVTTRVRREDGTYRTSKRLVFRSDLPGRSFGSQEDYMVATKFQDVTYAWPQGKGSFSKNFKEISFEGRQINCRVVGRDSGRSRSAPVASISRRVRRRLAPALLIGARGPKSARRRGSESRIIDGAPHLPHLAPRNML